jgi:hypothetical protein
MMPPFMMLPHGTMTNSYSSLWHITRLTLIISCERKCFHGMGPPSASNRGKADCAGTAQHGFQTRCGDLRE